MDKNNQEDRNEGKDIVTPMLKAVVGFFRNLCNFGGRYQKEEDGETVEGGSPANTPVTTTAPLAAVSTQQPEPVRVASPVSVLTTEPLPPSMESPSAPPSPTASSASGRAEGSPHYMKDTEASKSRNAEIAAENLAREERNKPFVAASLPPVKSSKVKNEPNYMKPTASSLAKEVKPSHTPALPGGTKDSLAK